MIGQGLCFPTLKSAILYITTMNAKTLPMEPSDRLAYNSVQMATLYTLQAQGLMR